MYSLTLLCSGYIRGRSRSDTSFVPIYLTVTIKDEDLTILKQIIPSVPWGSHEMSHETNNILIPILLIPIKQKSFRFPSIWDFFNRQIRIKMLEYKETLQKFSNRKEAKKYFGKQFFNKLWREDNFRIINNSSVAYFDELQKNTSSSCW